MVTYKIIDAELLLKFFVQPEVTLITDDTEGALNNH